MRKVDQVALDSYLVIDRGLAEGDVSERAPDPGDRIRIKRDTPFLSQDESQSSLDESSSASATCGP